MNEVEAILVSAALAGILAFWGVFTQRVVVRRSDTFAYLSRIDLDRDMIAAKKVFVELTTKLGGLATFAEQDHENSDEVASIRLVLNDLELMSIGIQYGSLDLKIIKRYSRSTIVRYWYYAAPFVYRLRHRLAAPSAFHEFEELARWMQDIRMPKRRTWLRLLF